MRDASAAAAAFVVAAAAVAATASVGVKVLTSSLVVKMAHPAR